MFYNENNFFFKLYFCLIRCRSPVFPKDPIYSQQVQWAGVCPGRPAPALFVTTDRHNHLIGPKIHVALLENNGLKMQA